MPWLKGELRRRHADSAWHAQGAGMASRGPSGPTVGAAAPVARQSPEIRSGSPTRAHIAVLLLDAPRRLQ